ncbi:hypothetical protein VTO42DRAFT_512 [Malbranchea cinnamomea]
MCLISLASSYLLPDSTNPRGIRDIPLLMSESILNVGGALRRMGEKLARLQQTNWNQPARDYGWMTVALYLANIWVTSHRMPMYVYMYVCMYVQALEDHKRYIPQKKYIYIK